MPSAVTFEAVILEAVMKGMMKLAELTAEGEKRNVVRVEGIISIPGRITEIVRGDKIVARLTCRAVRQGVDLSRRGQRDKKGEE
jgi:hypothetical protein